MPERSQPVSPIPLTRRSHILHIANTLQHIGFCPNRVFSQAGVPMWHHGDPEDWIPLRDVLLVMATAARVTADNRFGLLVGESNSLEDFGTVGRLICKSVSTYGALKNVCRLVKYYSPITQYRMTEAGELMWLSRHQQVCMGVDDQHHEQYVVRQMMRIVERFAGSASTLVQIAVRAQGSPRLEETEAFANVRVRYGAPYTAIAIPRSLLNLRIDQGNKLPAGEMKELRRGTRPTDDFVGSLRQALGSLVHDAFPTIDQAAESAGIRVRTLQRRLSMDGLTYRDLIDQVRYQAATQLLEDPKVTVDEVAHVVGYSGTPHFIRAFRRWSGISPGEYRRQNFESAR